MELDNSRQSVCHHEAGGDESSEERLFLRGPAAVSHDDAEDEPALRQAGGRTGRSADEHGRLHSILQRAS